MGAKNTISWIFWFTWCHDQILGSRTYNVLNIWRKWCHDHIWVWVQKAQYPEYFGSNIAQIIILLLRTSYYNSLLVEQSMILNRRSDDGKKSRKFDFKTKHFRWSRLLLLFLTMNKIYNLVFSEMRGRPDDDEEPEKKPRRKISAWWDFKLDDN